MADFYEFAAERLAEAGYIHYEISNWGLPGFESLHNLKYWRRESYLGFGAGAHSFHSRQRWANAHDPSEYISSIGGHRLPVEQMHELSDGEALEEELFLGLRQLKGIDIARIERDYGATLTPRIHALAEQGLVKLEGERVRLAPERLTVSNEVFVALLGELDESVTSANS